MPAYCSVPDAVAVKIVGVYQSNRARGLPTIAGVVISIDPENGRIRGILGAGALTAARTAAATGACLARLAPAAPGPLGMTGAGVEARTHLLVADALGWHDVVVYDHREANVEALRRVGGRARARRARARRRRVPARRRTEPPASSRGSRSARAAGALPPDSVRDGRARPADRLLDVGRRGARQLGRAARERRPRPARRGRHARPLRRAGARSTAPSGAGSPTARRCARRVGWSSRTSASAPTTPSSRRRSSIGPRRSAAARC